jgi:hypothetical protein
VITPFVRLQAGYQVALESNTFRSDIDGRYYYSESSYYWSGYYPETSAKLNAKGGWMVHPSVGVTVYTSAGLGISLSAGYRYQQLTYKDNDDNYTLSVEYNRLSLTLGIIF